MIELIRYGYSGMTRCPGRGQATLAEGPNPPGRDFVNALVRGQPLEQVSDSKSMRLGKYP